MRGRGNPAARASVVLGLAAVLALPAAIVASRYVPKVSLLEALYGGVPAAHLLALLAGLTARRARRRLQLSLGRAGGERAARFGTILALLGLYLGLTGVLALVFYAVLRAYS